MSYGIINIKYGGAESTKFVEKDEFYSAQSVPSGASVDLYINMEYYSMVKKDLDNTSHSLQSSKDSCNNAFKRLQNMQEENDNLREHVQELQERLERAFRRLQNLQAEMDSMKERNLEMQLERANRVIDYMLERSE